MTEKSHDPTGILASTGVEASLRETLAARGAFAKASRERPWYDSNWLNQYIAAKSIIRRIRPSLLPDFVAAFAPLRTRPDFEVRALSASLTAEDLSEVRRIIADLPVRAHETHEVDRFGRTVVHDHPRFTEMQLKLEALVSEAAGEAVESAYNFLSLYSELGVCEPHMDAPQAKWTLDICIDQSRPWPIHFSQIVDWPEAFSPGAADWRDAVRSDPGLVFTPRVMEPGEALLFSGSSQWHYRDAMPDAEPGDFCNLLFFHYIPAGTKTLVDSANWARLFDLPELALIIGERRA